MSATSIEDIKARIQNYVDTKYDGEWSEFNYSINKDGIDDVEGLMDLVVVEAVGGEGEGDHCHVVLKATTHLGHEIYFKKDGYYSSWDGKNWEDGEFYHAIPRLKTITVYDKVSAPVSSSADGPVQPFE
jgi:hypothetical protein